MPTTSKMALSLWRSGMRRLPLLLASISSGVLAAGCGDFGGARSTASKTVAANRSKSPAAASRRESKLDHDGDNDNPADGYYDRDDFEVLSYGEAASPSDQRQVAMLVKRYYVSAAIGDGSKACSLMYSLVAEIIPEEYGEPPGLSALRGRTCAIVLTKMFKRDHRRVMADMKALHLIGMRFTGNRGLALLGTGARVERFLLMHRESGIWKVAEIADERIS